MDIWCYRLGQGFELCIFCLESVLKVCIDLRERIRWTTAQAIDLGTKQLSRCQGQRPVIVEALTSLETLQFLILCSLPV